MGNGRKSSEWEKEIEKTEPGSKLNCHFARGTLTSGDVAIIFFERFQNILGGYLIEELYLVVFKGQCLYCTTALFDKYSLNTLSNTKPRRDDSH